MIGYQLVFMSGGCLVGGSGGKGGEGEGEGEGENLRSEVLKGESRQVYVLGKDC